MVTSSRSSPKHHRHPEQRRPNLRCLRCGAAYYAPPSQAGHRRYCSARCRSLAKPAADNRGRHDVTPAPAPKRGEPGFIDSIPKALALVEAQLTVASGAQASLLEIERDALRWLLRQDFLAEQMEQMEQEAG